MDKLKSVEAKCKSLNSSVQIKIIVADLCKQAMDLQLYLNIAKEVSGLDVAMLVNNAGVAHGGPFKDIPV